MVKGGLAARDAYIAVKGHDVPLLPHFLYDLVVKFDEARKEPDAYTFRYYFDEEGAMQAGLIRYNEDSLQIKVGFGAIETIDITERFFENATGDSVHQDIEKMIREHMKEAKDDNNK